MNISELKEKYIYLAGPYTNGVKGENARHLVAIADCLMDHGVNVFNPLLSHWHDKYFPHPWEWWMDKMAPWIAKCDLLLFVPGESRGVEIEKFIAIQLGIPVHDIREIDGAEFPRNVWVRDF